MHRVAASTAERCAHGCVRSRQDYLVGRPEWAQDCRYYIRPAPLRWAYPRTRLCAVGRGPFPNRRARRAYVRHRVKVGVRPQHASRRPPALRALSAGNEPMFWSKNSGFQRIGAGCRDVHVGSALHRGISGGQAKRCNIAIELVAQPGLIFFDEPTSGLDSAMAREVIAVVQRLAQQGRTIVATIHQPSEEIYGMFDRLLLLSKGQVAFQGGVAGSEIEFLVSLGFPYAAGGHGFAAPLSPRKERMLNA
eukprot:scaffold3759_cov425-Prasinococcus_capsulatus_cf.AAC.13